MAICEARTAALHIMSREAEQDSRIAAICDAKLVPVVAQVSTIDGIIKKIQERLSLQNKQVNDKIKQIDDENDDKIVKMRQKVEQIDTELGESIIKEVMNKFKLLQ